MGRRTTDVSVISIVSPTLAYSFIPILFKITVGDSGDENGLRVQTTPTHPHTVSPPYPWSAPAIRAILPFSPIRGVRQQSEQYSLSPPSVECASNPSKFE